MTSVDDEARKAWTSGDLPRMRKALSLRTSQIARHFLLMSIVDATYKTRANRSARRECERVARMHLEEFEAIAPALIADIGFLPRVSTFQNLAVLLTEDGRFGEAIEVCELAMHYGLHDGTKSGFPGRIQRINRKRAKQEES